MNPLAIPNRVLKVIFIGLVLFVSLACLPTSLISNSDSTNQDSTSTATTEATKNPSQPTSSEITSTASSQQEPVDIQPTDESLNATGPWLLIETTEGLWAANPDGSALQQLTTVDYWGGNLKQAIQPAGNQIVFITPGGYDFHNMALNLLTLPDGQVTKITDLTSPSTEEYADSAPGDSGFEALRAIGEMVSYAWSPDGSQLAFTGVMNGPSADIYLYNVQTGSITRVSQDPEQDTSPSWSPDGNHLLYLAVDGFGTGAGWAMSGVWAASGTGSNPTQLFATSSSGEEIEGWLDNSTVLLATWEHPCGLQNLRLLNLENNQTTTLYSDCFRSATADGDYGAALFSTENGVYMLTADDPTPTLVDSADNASVEHRYPGDQIFSVKFTNGGMATFGNITQYDYQVSPVQAPRINMDVAVYGAIWGWTSSDAANSGVWITGPGMDIGRIYDGSAIQPIWNQDNDLLFFASQDSGYTLYLTTFNSFYTDLHSVNSFESYPSGVAWLGWK